MAYWDQCLLKVHDQEGKDFARYLAMARQLLFGRGCSFPSALEHLKSACNQLYQYSMAVMGQRDMVGIQWWVGRLLSRVKTQANSS